MYNWEKSDILASKSFKCGHCGNSLASEKGYYSFDYFHRNINGYIYICHHCKKPTFFDSSENQTPGAFVGNPVNHIPEKNVELLFDEARKCFAVGAYTSSVMCCRKLLMNISVSEGAPEGKNFAEYVNFLNEKNHIPLNGKQWVESIRKLGNEANHKIELKQKEDASRIINFTEMLLKFIYELPGIMKESEK